MTRKFRIRTCAHINAAALMLVWALACGATAATAEVVFQGRQDAGVGPSPTAVTLLPGTAPTLLVANASGLAAFRFEDGILDPGPRSREGAGAHVLVAGPFGVSGAAAVAYASRAAPRIGIAPVDAHGSVGAPEFVDLPALPRAARASGSAPGAPAALVVAHDDGMSIITRAAAGWQRRELAGPRFANDFAIGDLDGDGQADLVVADESTNTLTVTRADGSRDAALFATLRRPRRVVLADVNGDGRADALVIGDDGLAVHLVDAGGRMGAAQILASGDHLADVAAADVNGDSRVDLAVLDRSRSTLGLLLGAGDGRFSAGDAYLVGYGAETAVLADLDVDGKIDALTLNRLGDNATVLRGRGGGVFDGIVCLRSEIGDLTAVAVDDFNSDEHSDLAVASEDGGRVALFLGKGDGRFNPMAPLSVGRQPRALVTGDFNLDERPDLAVVNFGGDAVAILEGDGRGGFAPPQLIRVGTGPSAIGVGSFGTDSSNDLAIVNSLSDSVSVLYGDGRGQFPNVATFPVSARPSFLIIGDTNSDGHQDLVVGSQFSESVAILLGDGRQLGAPTTNKLKGVARPSLAEDFDQDGEMDLVNPDEAAGIVEILPGTGPGRFGTPIRIFVGRDPHAAATGDFDHDGRIDIAVMHRATQTIAVLLNRSRITPARGKVQASLSKIHT